MALFKQYSGTVYDENNIPVNSFRYRGYIKQQNVWSDWYTSNNSRYSINLGDGEFLTQDGFVDNGSDLLIQIETNETIVSNKKFCYTLFVINNQSTVVRDVQIKPIQKPNILDNHWDIFSASDSNTKVDIEGVTVSLARVNDKVNIVENYSDNSSWEFNGNVMYQHTQFGNINVFNDRLGIINVKYDWGIGLGYETSKNKIYTNISNGLGLHYIPIIALVTNKKGLTNTSRKYIKVRYRVPVPDMVITPEPYTIIDTLTIDNATINLDNNIIETAYILNNITQVVNDIPEYKWFPITTGFTGTEMKIEFNITYTDGFETLNLLYTRYLELKNIPLTFDTRVSTVENVDKIITVIDILNVEDLDGDTALANFKWDIYYKTPIDNEYKLVYKDEYGDLPAFLTRTFNFNVAGEYKIVITGKDEAGEETVKETIVDVTLEQLGIGTGTMVNYVEWE